jgi:hypothetical protein
LDVFADVDHTGDDLARDLAVRLRDLGARLCSSPAVVATTFGLSAQESRTEIVKDRTMPNRSPCRVEHGLGVSAVHPAGTG